MSGNKRLLPVVEREEGGGKGVGESKILREEKSMA